MPVAALETSGMAEVQSGAFPGPEHSYGVHMATLLPGQDEVKYGG